MFRLVFEPHDGRALSADSEEKREPARDIETATVESLKVLDTQWPIREADMGVLPSHLLVSLRYNTHTRLSANFIARRMRRWRIVIHNSDSNAGLYIVESLTNIMDFPYYR